MRGRMNGERVLNDLGLTNTQQLFKAFGGLVASNAGQKCPLNIWLR